MMIHRLLKALIPVILCVNNEWGLTQSPRFYWMKDIEDPEERFEFSVVNGTRGGFYLQTTVSFNQANFPNSIWREVVDLSIDNIKMVLRRIKNGIVYESMETSFARPVS